jgi:hypothetical protein
MSDRNIFGGRNPNGLYTPLSDDEQEVLERLAASGEFKLIIKDWGFVDKPKIRFGDARLEVSWNMVFDRPQFPMPLPFLHLELWTHSGHFLIGEKLPMQVNGAPLQVCQGVAIDMAWDILIRQMDPKLVRAIKTGSVGLTTRIGNQNLDLQQQRALRTLRKHEARIRAADAADVAKAGKKAPR